MGPKLASSHKHSQCTAACGAASSERPLHTGRVTRPVGAGRAAAGRAARPHCPPSPIPGAANRAVGTEVKIRSLRGSPQLLNPAPERRATSPPSFSLDDSGVHDPRWPRLKGCEKAPLGKTHQPQGQTGSSRCRGAGSAAEGTGSSACPGPAPGVSCALSLSWRGRHLLRRTRGSLGVLHRR